MKSGEMREKTKCLKALCSIVGGGAERLEELDNGGYVEQRHHMDMTWPLHTHKCIAVGLAVQTYTRFGLLTFYQGSGKS